MVYRQSQSNGEHDFDLHSPAGEVSAIEVTSSVDQTQEETIDAIMDERKGGTAISSRLCANSWYIHPRPNANINLLREKADQYLAAIEAAGISKFGGPTDDRPSVKAIHRKLGVVSGSVAS
jgi:hypothetical protein